MNGEERERLRALIDRAARERLECRPPIRDGDRALFAELADPPGSSARCALCRVEYVRRQRRQRYCSRSCRRRDGDRRRLERGRSVAS